MHAVKSRITAIAIVLLALTGAGRAQQPAPEPIDEEIAKQQKIFDSRAPMFPRATSPVEACRAICSFFPASAARSQRSAARTAGSTSARAPGRRFSIITRPKRLGGENVFRGRRQGARGRAVHRRPPDEISGTGAPRV
jgi:hypothetical protein